MVKQMVEVDVPEGWEVVGLRKAKHGEWYYMDLRRRHVWPEWLLQFARIHGPWLFVASNGAAFMARERPQPAREAWFTKDPALLVPHKWASDYAPPHNYSGDGWKSCAWRLPV